MFIKKENSYFACCVFVIIVLAIVFLIFCRLCFRNINPKCKNIKNYEKSKHKIIKDCCLSRDLTPLRI